ncbi:MAG: aldose 1-epimerase family protein [Nocardioides sp.]|uniref:aldose 1-epimerase family protein n=1 Tax=Nocardioides sp. TaxID=35761 RepID=UPI003F022254
MSTDDSPGPTSATGQQWELRHGAGTAYVAQAGAALRGFAVDGTWLTEPSPADAPPTAGNGQLLVPWPNRVRDGRWTLDGTVQQLALTEPARGNASHGLLRHAAYACTAEAAESVTLQAEVFPQPGYPFRLSHAVTYALDSTGLVVTHEITHHGAGRAPVAVGAHPYLRVGDVPVADCSLRVGADTVLLVDDRMLPVGSEPVHDEHDWRDGPVIRDRRVDAGYTRLAVVDGQVRHTLTAPDGRGVTLWAEEAFGWVQLFTTDRLPARDLAVAVEPMTAPADALSSGEGLAWLGTGETLRVRWGLTPVGF